VAEALSLNSSFTVEPAGAAGAAPLPPIPHDLTRSWRVYQAKAASSLNAHAANLFNYSPSSLAF